MQVINWLYLWHAGKQAALVATNLRTSQSGAAAADDVRDMGQVANVIVSDVYFPLLPARRSCTTHTSLVAVVTG